MVAFIFVYVYVFRMQNHRDGIIAAMGRFHDNMVAGKCREPREPRRQPGRRTEWHEQRDVCRWLRAHRIVFCGTLNGARLHSGSGRPDIVGAQLKAIGLQKGLPDLLIFTPPPYSPGCPGVAIEMKRDATGRVSDEQRAWLDQLEAYGWKSFVGFGADATIRSLSELGYGQP
jgi:hypothetical protein